MSHAIIRQLFEDELNNYAVNKGVRIAWENVEFIPTVGEVYLESILKPADTSSLTLLGSDHTKLIGIYQISIHTEKGMGIEAANIIVEELKDIFPINKRFEIGSFHVQPITPLKVMHGLTTSNYTLPVFFQYRSDIN